MDVVGNFSMVIVVFCNMLCVWKVDAPVILVPGEDTQLSGARSRLNEHAQIHTCRKHKGYGLCVYTIARFRNQFSFLC